MAGCNNILLRHDIVIAPKVKLRFILLQSLVCSAIEESRSSTFFAKIKEPSHNFQAFGFGQSVPCSHAIVVLVVLEIDRSMFGDF